MNGDFSLAGWLVQPWFEQHLPERDKPTVRAKSNGSPCVHGPAPW